MKCNLYSISFCGYYPVGAVAVVLATSVTEAERLFLIKLTKDHPTLASHNTDDVLRTELLQAGVNAHEKSVYILLDGNY